MNKGRVWPLIVCCALLAGFAGCTSKKQVVQHLPDYRPQHCYRTLAEVDCHTAPLENEAYRSMGWSEMPTGHQELNTEVNCFDLFIFVHSFCYQEKRY